VIIKLENEHELIKNQLKDKENNITNLLNKLKHYLKMISLK